MATWDEALVRFAFDFARRVAGHDADAEDLAQEALLDLAEAQPSPVPDRAFVGRRIVLGAKMLRRANLTRARHERAVVRQGVEGRGEEGAEARDALALLDPEDRHAVELRFLHGLSYAEVAHVLGVTEPAARMRVHRALGSLRDRLGPRAEAMVAALPLFLAPPSLAVQVARAAVLAGGGIAVKKIALAIVLVVALTGGAFAVSRSMRAPPPSRAEPQAQVETSPAVEAPANPPSPAAPEPPGNPAPDGKGRVTGRIVFEDGAPAQGLTVKLSGSPATPCTTDDDGRFRLEGEWVATRDLAIVEGDTLYLRIAKAELRADAEVRVDLALKRGTQLDGAVMRAGGPVADARVTLERPGAEGAGTMQGSAGFARTRADGTFAFPFLPDGLYTLVATATGIEPTSLDVEVSPGLRPQVIPVKDARPLRVRFVPASAAWRGKRLIFGVMSVENKPIRLTYDRRVDERGEIVVEAPPPGRYMVTQLPGGYREIEVTEASVPEVVVELRGARVFGKVSVPCRISVGSVDGRTDAEGNYDLDIVPAGRAEVTVRMDKVTIQRPALTLPDAGEMRLDIELKGVKVRGRLVSEGDYGRYVGLGSKVMGYSIEVGADGAFAIPYVERGTYEIYGFTQSQQGETRSVTVGGEDLDVGDVILDPGVEVPLVVAAPAGVRLAGRHDAWAHEGTKPRLVRVLLDESGRGTVRLPAGKWRLSLHVGDLPQKDVEIDVPVREPVRIELTR